MTNDCTYTQTSLESNKQANGGDGKGGDSCQHPVVSRNRAWTSVPSGAQQLSMAEVVHKVKRNEVTKPELELGFCHQSHVEWKLFSSRMNNSHKKVFVI